MRQYTSDEIMVNLKRATLHPRGQRALEEWVERVEKRRFVGKKYPYIIPYGAEVEVVKFYPRRKVIVRYKGQEIVTMTYNLRHIKS